MNTFKFDAWRAANDKACSDFLAGNSTLEIPQAFYHIPQDFGTFILIQPRCLLSLPPIGFVVRDSYYGGALKILCPKEIKTGDFIQITGKAKSGKSYHARIV